MENYFLKSTIDSSIPVKWELVLLVRGFQMLTHLKCFKSRRGTFFGCSFNLVSTCENTLNIYSLESPAGLKFKTNCSVITKHWGFPLSFAMADSVFSGGKKSRPLCKQIFAVLTVLCALGGVMCITGLGKQL